MFFSVNPYGLAGPRWSVPPSRRSSPPWQWDTASVAPVRGRAKYVRFQRGNSLAKSKGHQPVDHLKHCCILLLNNSIRRGLSNGARPALHLKRDPEKLAKYMEVDVSLILMRYMGALGSINWHHKATPSKSQSRHPQPGTAYQTLLAPATLCSVANCRQKSIANSLFCHCIITMDSMYWNQKIFFYPVKPVTFIPSNWTTWALGAVSKFGSVWAAWSSWQAQGNLKKLRHLNGFPSSAEVNYR